MKEEYGGGFNFVVIAMFTDENERRNIKGFQTSHSLALTDWI